MGTNIDKLKAPEKPATNRVWKRALIVLIAGVLATGLLAYSKRHAIIVWHLQADKDTQEKVIGEMLDNAKPIIEQKLKMNFPEKVFSQVLGDRNERRRQGDALADIRTFVELGFKNHSLVFKDVHNLSAINGCLLNGFEFALCWDRGNTKEVLVAFNISFLKRRIDKMQVNDNCNFFMELKSYVETKAKNN
jgi:hypothetical protein